MNDSFKIYSRTDILNRVAARVGETKIGECVQTIQSLDDLSQTNARYVLLGIPEDIGVRANYGISGAATAWEAAVSSFLNIQSNRFFTGNEVVLAGHVHIEAPADDSINSLRKKVSEIDGLVMDVVQKIVSCGKIPLIIGGGHNNAYPIIKGTSMAIGAPMGAINIDAHADLRRTDEGRHSGNGFSFALAEGCLSKYLVYGLHESYNNEYTLETIQGNEHIMAAFFDQLPQDAASRRTQWQKFMMAAPALCGLELDLDSVQNTLSSAYTPSGFSLNEVRSMVRFSGKAFTYLHICEGAAELSDGRTDRLTGKAIAYLVSDFIKGQNTQNQT